MPRRVEKVYAYITHGGRLLVFTQLASPHVGIQVPGGTLEPGEMPESGVMREAYEETGLPVLEFIAPLGEHDFDARPYGVDEIHHRSFFHLAYRFEPPDTWDHFETSPSDGTTESIRFSFFWVELPHGVPELRTGMGAFVGKIVV